MASKGGKYHKKSSKSSKKGFRKTTGGASYRNYSKKSKNLDYKYRIMDIADTNQSAWYEQVVTKYRSVISNWYGAAGRQMPEGNVRNAWFKEQENIIAALVQGYFRVVNTMCHFIPVSTSQMVAKNISLEVRCKYPFAYCLFQNTKQFRDVFVRFMSANMDGVVPDVVRESFRATIAALEQSSSVSNETLTQIKEFMAMIYAPFCFNPFGLDDSGFVLPMLNNSCEDWSNISTNLSPTSAMWGQICRAQSSYREVRSANNAGEYFSTINAYYTKASTYLTTSSAKDPYTSGYKKGNIVRENSLDANTFTSLGLCPDTKKLFGVDVSVFTKNKLRTLHYDTIFNSGDIIICILPCWFINSVNPQAQGQVSRPAIDSTQVMRDAIPSINMVRHYYVLNQDTGIKEVLNNDPDAANAIVITQVEKSVANVPTSQNTGNNVQKESNGLFRNIMLRSQGIQVSPILRADLDDTAQKTNCVVVDEKCYDETNQELEMQAYMDLQPVPANAGDAILEDVEGEDTMNCNAIVSCGNKSDSETLLDASVSNTGPQVYQTTDNSFQLHTDDISDFCNFGFGYTAENTYTTAISQSGYVTADHAVKVTNGASYYTINTDIIGQYVNLINQLVPFRLIIPKFEESQSDIRGYGRFVFDSSAATYYSFGYTPDGISNNTFIQCILPFGFGYMNSQGYNDYCCQWCVPSLTIEKDGESATGGVTILPLTYELIQNLMIKKFIQTSNNTEIIQTYGFTEVCAIDQQVDDSAYTPTGETMQITGGSSIYFYLTTWMQEYITATGASKAWKKIKGFFCKVGKFIKDKAFPFIKKVADKVAGIVPAPYGTVISAVGTGVDMIQSTVNLIAAKKTTTNATQEAIQDDTVTDYFTVIPQYRLASSDEPARIEEQGTDWVDGDVMQVPVSQYGETTTHLCVHKLANHPQYFQIRNALQGTRIQGLDVGAFCQQRIKVIFKKTGVPPSVARAYKAIMMLGSDTQYLNSQTDFQTVQTDSSTQNQQ